MPDFEDSLFRDPLERLSELAASGSARAHGLPAEQVRALGARRHRRRIAVTLAAASAVVAVLASGAVAVAGQLDRTSMTPQPAGSSSPSLAPPTRPENFTPGTRPGLGARAFEPGIGKGALGNARGSAGAGNQPSTRDIGRPGTRPAPPALPDSPPSYQATEQPPAVAPPTLGPSDPSSSAESQPSEPPPSEPPASEPAPSEPATSAGLTP